MKIFMVEWWNERSGRYEQEYYSDILVAAHRMVVLMDILQDSRPAIETLEVDTSTFDS